jgi:hypothetical protein
MSLRACSTNRTQGKGDFVGPAFDDGLGPCCPTCSDDWPKPLWDSAKASAANGTPTFVFGGKFANGRGSAKFTLQPASGGDPKFGAGATFRLMKIERSEIGVGLIAKDIGGKGCDLDGNINIDLNF